MSTWALNSCGRAARAPCSRRRWSAWALWRTGTGRARNWFVEESRGALVLLALWPLALLFPAAVTFGLGQVFERLEAAIAEWLLDTPFIDWMPVRQFELEPLVPGVELLCVMLGALVPCLLAFLVTRSIARRAVLLPLTLLAGRGGQRLVGRAELRPRARLGLARACRCSSASRLRWSWGCCCCRRRAGCAPPCC